jgi:NAD(P)-dependent dehydrogenase (short-subunit alcohol dehydrogenase family)
MSQPDTALVTGASKGVGRGIALGLAAAGWNVAVNYNGDRAGAEETAAGIRDAGKKSWVLQADVGQADQVDAMFQRLDEELVDLGLVVNNAGVQTWSPLLDLEEADFDRTIRTNLKGTFLCTQRAARRMAVHGRGGSIINIGSGANKRPFAGLVDYTASKGGIDLFTQVAAVELGPERIRVNSVAPGAIEIERTKREADDYAGTWGPITPMRRIGYPRDVAAAVVFLAGAEAEFITGQTLYVDGGLMTQPPWPYE